jgi:hypothetical protein
MAALCDEPDVAGGPDRNEHDHCGAHASIVSQTR